MLMGGVEITIKGLPASLFILVRRNQHYFC
jgi:hypothetical protein